MTDSLGFFQKVTPSHVAKVEQMIAEGAVIEVGFFTVKATHKGGQLFAVSLPCSTTTLLKGAAASGAHNMSVSGLKVGIDEGYSKMFPHSEEMVEYIALSSFQHGGEYIPEGKSVFFPKSKLLTGLPLKLASEVQPEVPTPGAPPKAKVATGPQKAPKKNGKIALKDATEILQSVAGTDAGSTYHVVALGERMKVAARIKKSALSIRIEGDLQAGELKQAQQVGFTKSTSGHLSMHIDCQNVPPVAVIGGMLFRLGVSFNRVMTNEKEMPVEH